jgi:hypothetical protein
MWNFLVSRRSFGPIAATVWPGAASTGKWVAIVQNAINPTEDLTLKEPVVDWRHGGMSEPGYGLSL